MPNLNKAIDRNTYVRSEAQRSNLTHRPIGLGVQGLADVFAKPRPIWVTPALVATFGDAYIEGTGYEGSSLLPWSYTVLNQ